VRCVTIRSGLNFLSRRLCLLQCLSLIFACFSTEWVSEWILNSTIRLHSAIHAGKYRTEDRLKTQTIHKLKTTQKNKQRKTQKTTLAWLSRLLWQSAWKPERKVVYADSFIRCIAIRLYERFHQYIQSCMDGTWSQHMEWSHCVVCIRGAPWWITANNRWITVDYR